MEVPHVQTVEKVVEVPMVGQTMQGAERHVNVPLPPVRQMGQTETVTVTEYGPPLPTEHAGQVIKAAPEPMPAPAPVMTAVPVMMAAPAPVTYTAAPAVTTAAPVTTASVTMPVTTASVSVPAAEPVVMP